MKMVSCAGCEKPIKDKFLDKVLDQTWHTYCVTCSDCKKGLEGKCFFRDGKLFCKNDFFKAFRPKCVKCGDCIEANDLVLRAKDNIYHKDCFQCDSCKKILNQGDLFGLRNDLVFCLHHFKDTAKSPAPIINNNNNNSNNNSNNNTNSSNSSNNNVNSVRNNLSDNINCARLNGGNSVNTMGISVTSPLTCNSVSSSVDSKDYYLSSENAIHPMAEQCPPHHDPMPGLPAYGPVGHPPPPPLSYTPSQLASGSFIAGLASLNHHCLGAPVSPASALCSMLTSAGAPGMEKGSPGNGASGGVRKGRPRKRKTQLTTSDTSSTGLACSMDSLSESLHDSSLSNGSIGVQHPCHGSMNGSNKSKRVRTSFKHQQLKTMKAYFAVNQNPDAKDLKGLAAKTGLTKRVLQVWFQNARAKYRKNNSKIGDCSNGKANSPLCASSIVQSSSNGSMNTPSPGTPSTSMGHILQEPEYDWWTAYGSGIE